MRLAGMSKSNIVRSSVKSVLAGNKGELVCAFTWAKTPQGYDYWERQYECGLTIRARYRLRAMLRRATAP